MPSSSKAAKAMFSLLPQKEGKIYELGSGWGHVIFPLAKRYPAFQIYAIEGSFIPWFVSSMVQKIFRFSNLTIERKNFFNLSLEGANGIVCYLYPGAMKRLKMKFQEELKPGTFIVTNTFAIPGLMPIKIEEVDDLWKSKIYLYVI